MLGMANLWDKRILAACSEYKMMPLQGECKNPIKQARDKERPNHTVAPLPPFVTNFVTSLAFHPVTQAIIT